MSCASTKTKRWNIISNCDFFYKTCHLIALPNYLATTPYAVLRSLYFRIYTTHNIIFREILKMYCKVYCTAYQTTTYTHTQPFITTIFREQQRQENTLSLYKNSKQLNGSQRRRRTYRYENRKKKYHPQI